MTQEKTAPKDFLGIRAKREALGMTLKDVFALTRISVVNLEAIENGDFHDLPVPIYAKNFIKIYARALDLDSKPILDSYEAYLNTLQINQAPVKEQETMPEQEPSTQKPIKSKVYLVVAFIVFIIAVVTVAIFQQQQPEPSVPVKPQTVVKAVPQDAVNTPVNPPVSVVPPVNLPAPPVQTQPKTAGQPVVKETSKQVPPPALPQQKAVILVKPSPKQNVNVPAVEKKAPAAISGGTDVLAIKATEETWLRIKIDQNPPFEVLLKPGEEIEHKGASFVVDVGNAGGTKMKFKGKTIENLGKSGDVVRLQLP